MMGNLHNAERAYLDGVRAGPDHYDYAYLAKNLEPLGVVRAKRGDWRKAARLCGCTNAWREKHGYFARDEIPDYDRSLDTAQKELGPMLFEQEWQRGAQMDIQEAAERALLGEL